MMGKRTRLAVIFGGRSGEHEVSLMSARSVLNVLNPAKYEVVQIGVTAGNWLSGEDAIDRFEKQEYSPLIQVVLLPEPRGGQLFQVKDNQLEPLCAA